MATIADAVRLAQIVNEIQHVENELRQRRRTLTDLFWRILALDQFDTATSCCLAKPFAPQEVKDGMPHLSSDLWRRRAPPSKGRGGDYHNLNAERP